MDLSRLDRKYWIPVTFSHGLKAAISKDGLLYMFMLKDIQGLISDLPKGQYGWFFNHTRDRYCIEYIGDDRVTVNPSKMYDLFEEYPVEDSEFNKV